MARKSKVELTEKSARQAIADGKPASMTQLSHLLGYKGSVSSSLTKKFRAILPDIDALLAANKPAGDGKAAAKAAKPAAPAGDAAKPKGGGKIKGAKPSKWPRHAANPFREGSYSTCFDILAAHPVGLPREKLIELLAKTTGKDLTKASFDAQVVLSARGNSEGLNPFEGPRNRSCRPGFWVERKNSHVKLVLP